MSQFGGVGVNCHQPFGSQILFCPDDPENPSAYQPVFDGLGDQTYSGDFDCEPSGSARVEADPVPDVSQFLSPDQISQIDQFWTYDQYQPQNPGEGFTIANADGFPPTSDSMDNFQPIDPGMSNIFDEAGSGSQVEFDVSPEMADFPISDGQDIPSSESFDDSPFSDADFSAPFNWGKKSKF